MSKKQLRIGLIGYSFMGRAHSNAFHQVNHFFPSSYELVPQAVCGRDEAKVKEFAAKWGYKSVETDWRKLIARDDIEKHYWATVFPCIMLFITVLSFNLLGDELARRFDIREAAV